MEVSLIGYTPYPVHVVAFAGKNCYDALKGAVHPCELQLEDCGEYVKMLIERGHESPLEHVSFTFYIKGVTRALLAQLTRHRIASFSVKSQRYAKPDGAIIPPSLANSPKARKIYERCVEECYKAYSTLSEVIPKEDARFVLPEATMTDIVVTMNARELRHFFGLRCCNRAQWEIRDLANTMLMQCKEVAPELFYKSGAQCLASGVCPEGDKGCGKAKKC